MFFLLSKINIQYIIIVLSAIFIFLTKEWKQLLLKLF